MKVKIKELSRCEWCTKESIYVKYHDREWGVPTHDEKTLFEFLVLEAAQAGLSWITVLKKRENYKKAFNNFDPSIIAMYDEKKIAELMLDKGIVRNRLKINAAINNAARFLEIQKKFGSFDKYLWSFTKGKQIVNKWDNISQIPSKSELSDRLTLDLKKNGFKFVGSTICYAYLQACGLINDHLSYCYKYKLVQQD